jgi:hypothetical protein
MGESARRAPRGKQSFPPRGVGPRPGFAGRGGAARAAPFKLVNPRIHRLDP